MSNHADSYLLDKEHTMDNIIDCTIDGKPAKFQRSHNHWYGEVWCDFPLAVGGHLEYDSNPAGVIQPYVITRVSAEHGDDNYKVRIRKATQEDYINESKEEISKLQVIAVDA